MPDVVTLSPARAFDLQAGIAADIAGMRRSWARLASRLHEFHAAQGWRSLGSETFNEWLAQPEIGLRRKHAYVLIQAWGEFVVTRDVPPAELDTVDLTKVETVLPALNRGEVDPEEALADCRALSRSDLREKYRGDPHRAIDPHAEPWEVCPDCGKTRRTA